MIVKFIRDLYRTYSVGSPTREFFKENGDRWFRVEKPFNTRHVSVKIFDGESTMSISSRFVEEIINDERVGFQSCGYCGHVQEKGKGNCTLCKSGGKYLMDLIKMQDDGDTNSVLKLSLKKSIRC